MANKKHDVYMPLMIGDWYKGTRGMKAEVRGVYLSLLMYQWDNGFIPSDMEELALIEPEVGKVWVSLKCKFVESAPGKLQNKKMEEVRAFFSKQKDNGKLGGRPKGNKPKVISQAKLDWYEMVEFFKNSCLCCGYQFPEDERPTRDHVIPTIKGGVDDITNLQPLCRQCNSSKHADHSTDYRLKFLTDIPIFLREKWFDKITQTKPNNEPRNNLHNDIDIEPESIIDSEDRGVQGGEKNPVMKIVSDEPEVLIYPQFEDFWNAYDKNVGKEKSELIWINLLQHEKEAIMEYLPSYIQSTPERTYRKNPENFLAQKSWKDEIIIKPNGNNGQTGKRDTSYRDFANAG